MPRHSIASSIASASHGESLSPRALTHSLLLLLLLRLSCSLAGAAEPTSSLPVPCQPEQASALLRLKASLLLPLGDDDDESSSSPPCAAALGSWRNGTDCCSWEGVSCGYIPGYTGGGQVTSLDLSNCACGGGGGGGARLDDGALFSLPLLVHVNRTCNVNDDDESSSSKSELLPQRGSLKGPVDQVNPHYYFDLVMAEEMEETTSWKWMRTLLWAVLALGLYPIHHPLISLRGQRAPNPSTMTNGDGQCSSSDTLNSSLIMTRSVTSPSIVSHRQPFLLPLPAHALLLLLLLRLSSSLAGAAAEPTSSPPVPCEPEQASALLRLKASFLPLGNDDESSSSSSSSSSSCAAALGSWRSSTDCCSWKGVSCGYGPGHTGGQVISLDLSNCACGGGGAPLDAVELFSLLPSLTHVVSGSCDDDDGSSSSKSELPDSQQGLLEGLIDQQVNPRRYHYFDHVMTEETTSWKWIKALLWAVMAFGIIDGGLAPNPPSSPPQPSLSLSDRLTPLDSSSSPAAARAAFPRSALHAKAAATALYNAPPHPLVALLPCSPPCATPLPIELTDDELQEPPLPSMRHHGTPSDQSSTSMSSTTSIRTLPASRFIPIKLRPAPPNCEIRPSPSSSAVGEHLNEIPSTSSFTRATAATMRPTGAPPDLQIRPPPSTSANGEHSNDQPSRSRAVRPEPPDGHGSEL
ncbi:hypothetical protein HU200_031140 [Digitaria exilis]|uniref:Leucine-rich repeat-containing N-terminal plant-type domain-containing protein n=1 Tax=Digitaria exilis TaxID=1010633 RepID=A0A835BZ03_9POAL|nr:hypothetical protein HU200_031140 [Digitaria exilis]